MESESRRLMEEKSESELDDYDPVYQLQRGSKRRSWIKAIATHALVAISTFLVTIIFNARMSIVLSNIWEKEAEPLVYSPMTVATEYVVENPRKDAWANPIFFGPPSEESERAWDSLIFPTGQGIQIFPDEAEHLGELDTVTLSNGNPLLYLNVIHNLHCMRRLHRTLNSDHFYPNESAEWRAEDLHHTRHCLEAIRTSMMCNPDFSLNRYYWSGRKLHDLATTPEPAAKRQCVNWDRVQDFLRERRYDPDEIMHGGVTHREYEGRTEAEVQGCEWLTKFATGVIPAADISVNIGPDLEFHL